VDDGVMGALYGESCGPTRIQLGKNQNPNCTPIDFSILSENQQG
jgi:hypothetical protein